MPDFLEYDSLPPFVAGSSPPEIGRSALDLGDRRSLVHNLLLGTARRAAPARAPAQPGAQQPRARRVRVDEQPDAVHLGYPGEGRGPVGCGGWGRAIVAAP